MSAMNAPICLEWDMKWEFKRFPIRSLHRGAILNGNLFIGFDSITKI